MHKIAVHHIAALHRALIEPSGYWYRASSVASHKIGRECCLQIETQKPPYYFRFKTITEHYSRLSWRDMIVFIYTQKEYLPGHSLELKSQSRYSFKLVRVLANWSLSRSEGLDNIAILHQYPRFTCDKRWIHSWAVHWHPNSSDLGKMDLLSHQANDPHIFLCRSYADCCWCKTHLLAWENRTRKSGRDSARSCDDFFLRCLCDPGEVWSCICRGLTCCPRQPQKLR